jgi:hypothetical protein
MPPVWQQITRYRTTKGEVMRLGLTAGSLLHTLKGFVPRIRKERKQEANLQTFIQTYAAWRESRHGRRTEYKLHSKPNGGKRIRTRGRRDASLHSRSNRRKAAR